jgi:hypothetical protein
MKSTKEFFVCIRRSWNITQKILSVWYCQAVRIQRCEEFPVQGEMVAGAMNSTSGSQEASSGS